MIDTIYLEDGAENYPKTKDILNRFHKADVIPCKHYKEVFNPAGQSFRLQKKKPALILAKQNGKLAHPIPPSYGVGGTNNYYFSHLLNCLYDCRYCFLQGMYPSAHYLLFVNFEDFEQEIKKITNNNSEHSWFFSGYDCDSLALESVTGFAEHFLPFFAKLPNAWIELRTKSVATQVLQRMNPLSNAVVAFSFTPDEVSKQIEHGVPSVSTRIKAMKKLAKLGWKLGLRIDPLIHCQDFELRYNKLFEEIFEVVPEESIHSVSLGAFRMPSGFFKKIEKLYPEERLLAGNWEKKDGMIAYQQEIASELKSTAQKLILNYLPESKLFTCET
jgi:spore photoproduct lyase